MAPKLLAELFSRIAVSIKLVKWLAAIARFGKEGVPTNASGSIFSKTELLDSKLIGEVPFQGLLA
jgi:hypothetical protein